MIGWIRWVVHKGRMGGRQKVFVLVVSCSCRRNPLVNVYDRPSRIGPHFAAYLFVEFLFHTVHFLKESRRLFLVMDNIGVIWGETAGYRVCFSASAADRGAASRQTSDVIQISKRQTKKVNIYNIKIIEDFKKCISNKYFTYSTQAKVKDAVFGNRTQDWCSNTTFDNKIFMEFVIYKL